MRLSQAVLLVFFAAAAGQPSPTIEFHSPTPGQSVSGRSFTIEVEVAPSFHVPEQGKGILFLDGGKLLEVRQQRVTISMDGAGGLAEGPHKLRLELFALDGTTLAAQEVSFLKEGAPEETAGPFHDDKYDDEALQEMQEACSALAGLPQPSKPGKNSNEPVVIALGLPVLSSLTKYDGEETDDMRMVQEREEFVRDASQLPMFKVFFPSLIASIPHERGNYRYDVYLGFDKGDPLFDDAPSRESIDTQLRVLIGDAPITFRWFQYSGMEGKVFWIYNDLFRQAYTEGAEYFYMVNDDLLLVTPGWTDRQASCPARGWQGSLDWVGCALAGSSGLFAKVLWAAISEWRGRLTFANWWSDTWSSLVYGPAATFWLKEVEVRNTEVEGRRYPAFWEGADYIADEVSAGRRRVAAYCECVASGGVWRFQSCRLPPAPSGVASTPRQDPYAGTRSEEL